ncbi:MAG: hypothetical protein KDD58_12455 [Bdellovibrionales bacterium]|nr:hypothetical protein [Bdellovibrionales bacterium]
MSGELAKQHPLFFDIKEAGASMEEVAVDVIKSEGQNLTSYWYHSPLDVDLYVWFDEKKNIIKQQVSICGQICEWNIVDGVRTGYIFETEAENSDEESTIHYDLAMHKTSLNQAVELLRFAESLNSNTIEKLIYNFERNPMVDSIDPKELLSQYGNTAKDLKGSLALFFKKLFK